MPGWRAEDTSALWKAGLGQTATLRVCRANILSSAECWSAALVSCRWEVKNADGVVLSVLRRPCPFWWFAAWDFSHGVTQPHIASPLEEECRMERWIP